MHPPPDFEGVFFDFWVICGLWGPVLSGDDRGKALPVPDIFRGRVVSALFFATCVFLKSCRRNVFVFFLREARWKILDVCVPF